MASKRPKGTVAAEVVLRDGEVKLQRPERHKPGDRVLVEGLITGDETFGLDVRIHGSDGKPLYVTKASRCAERIHPHPGIDPALIGGLVEAVREETAAEIEPPGLGRFHSFEKYERRLEAARQRRRALAARMDLPAGAKEDDDA